MTREKLPWATSASIVKTNVDYEYNDTYNWFTSRKARKSNRTDIELLIYKDLGGSLYVDDRTLPFYWVQKALGVAYNNNPDLKAKNIKVNGIRRTVFYANQFTEFFGQWFPTLSEMFSTGEVIEVTRLPMKKSRVNVDELIISALDDGQDGYLTIKDLRAKIAEIGPLLSGACLTQHLVRLEGTMYPAHTPEGHLGVDGIVAAHEYHSTGRLKRRRWLKGPAIGFNSEAEQSCKLVEGVIRAYTPVTT